MNLVSLNSKCETERPTGIFFLREKNSLNLYARKLFEFIEWIFLALSYLALFVTEKKKTNTKRIKPMPCMNYTGRKLFVHIWKFM